MESGVLDEPPPPQPARATVRAIVVRKSHLSGRECAGSNAAQDEQNPDPEQKPQLRHFPLPLSFEVEIPCPSLGGDLRAVNREQARRASPAGSSRSAGRRR